MSGTFLERLRLWLRANLLRRRFEREMREEMAAHIERATARFIARGMSMDDAKRAARREFGDVAFHQTEGRASRGTLWLDALADDTRYGVRQLVRAPVFTLVATLSVATGIVVAVGAFTLLNAILFKPLPVPDAAGIYHVYTSDYDGSTHPYGSTSYADYIDFAANGAFKSLAATSWQRAAVSLHDAEPTNEYVGFVSQNYFATLGLKPARGRAPGSGEASEIVITWPYWQRTLGGDASVLGSSIRINSVPLTIVGVAPESFHGVGMGPPLIGWAPATLLPAMLHDKNVLAGRGARQFGVFGRLPAGESAPTAAIRLNATAKGIAGQNPERWTDVNKEVRIVSVLSHRESLAPPGARGELIAGLIGGGLLVLFVVLLSCTNVAAMLLGRAVGRDREITMRLALGASRGRLIRQLITESMLLALIGGAVSVIGLLWTLRIVAHRISFADMFDLRADWHVLAVALATSIVCALAFGLAPALHSLRLDLRSGLSGTSASPRPNRMRGALIALQVAASCVLIMLAFSAVRGVRAYVAINPGVALDGLVALEIDRGVFGDDTVSAARYNSRIHELVANEPGVRSAASTALLPLGNMYTDARIELAGRKIGVEINTVGASFFQTVGMRALRGRVFDAHDVRTAAPVAVVNQAFLSAYGRALFGGTVKVAETPGVRIVGVVPDISYHDLRETPRPLIYVVDEQIPRGSSSERFLLRVEPGTEATIAADLRNRVRRAFPELVVPAIEAMREHTARQTLPNRIGGRVALGIGAVELALAAVGLYGLLMFALLARTREIGVRLALGASARQASWSVMREGLRYALFGASAGILLAIPAAILAQNALPGARATDPLPFVAAFSAVLVASAVAAYVPARKAGRVDPAAVLRHD